MLFPSDEASASNPCTFPVVCIGGSAGSLAAYVEILRAVPAMSEMAIVIVSHRGLEESGRLIKLLAHTTRMDVVEVTDGIVLEAGRVFVAPPRRELTTDGVTLRLGIGPETRRGWPTMIADFFFSAASMCTTRAIAIILSGMGHDGSVALAAVKEAGGWTIAQSDASCPDMPQAAVDTNHVDLVLRAGEIGQYLASLSAQLRRVRRLNSRLSRSGVPWN